MKPLFHFIEDELILVYMIGSAKTTNNSICYCIACMGLPGYTIWQICASVFTSNHNELVGVAQPLTFSESA